MKKIVAHVEFSMEFNVPDNVSEDDVVEIIEEMDYDFNISYSGIRLETEMTEVTII